MLLAISIAYICIQCDANLLKLTTELDSKSACGHTVDASTVLERSLDHTYPILLQFARVVASKEARSAKDFLKAASAIKNISITNNTSASALPEKGFFTFKMVCENESQSWQPYIHFPMADRNVLTMHMLPFHVDLCQLSNCSTKCSFSLHGGLRFSARECCDEDKTLCRENVERGRTMLIIFNTVCALSAIALIPMVCRARRSHEENRGWALMELFLVGASMLYCILLLDWFPPSSLGCCVAVWLRQIGFATFYGSIVLKIYRNLEEYRVRKAQHVSVREEDMVKYLACLLALTITGLLAWTAGAWGDERMWKTAWPQCTPHGWSLLWHGYEALFLLYGGRLCYKARNSDWLERWQFTVAVCLEAIVTLVANLIRYSIRYSANSDTLFTVTFVQLQLTVSVNIVIIIAPKFYLVSGENNRRSLALGGQAGRAHPSLAKLRDNILNGTIDFAEVPIIDMNPEDIRAELKRVYTQLRMYKLKNLYQDNPHISKRKGGGKRWSDKPKPRRISVPSCSPQSKRVEEDEKSDLTVESAPHNVLLSTCQLEPNSSVRV